MSSRPSAASATVSDPKVGKPHRARPARPPKASPDARAAGLHLDGQLCFALYATSLAMTKVYRPLLAPLGLTYPQYVVMLALWQHGELSAGALGERVSLDSGTLVALVRKLMEMALVERRRSANDDRSVLISLTSPAPNSASAPMPCMTRWRVPRKAAPLSCTPWFAACTPCAAR